MEAAMKRHFEDLLAWCKSKGIKVTFATSKELLDYAGMNPSIAKKMGFKNIKKNEILIDVELPEDVQFRNLAHELVESELMQDGDSYWTAHKKSLAAEQWAMDKVKKFVLKRKGKAPLKSATIRISRSK
jgi:fructose-1-phosphate kinase PfkB-like protein